MRLEIGDSKKGTEKAEDDTDIPLLLQGFDGTSV